MEDNTEILVTLENHTTRLVNVEEHIKQLDNITSSIQDLSLAVNKLAINMESMLTEQREQGSRIKVLEEKPLKTVDDIKKTIITVIVSGVGGALISALISILVK